LHWFDALMRSLAICGAGLLLIGLREWWLWRGEKMLPKLDLDDDLSPHAEAAILQAISTFMASCACLSGDPRVKDHCLPSNFLARHAAEVLDRPFGQVGRRAYRAALLEVAKECVRILEMPTPGGRESRG
jgi:hypothetical protein